MKKIVFLFSFVIFTTLAWFIFLANPSDEQETIHHVPVISRHEILNASDFSEGIKQAVLNDDQQTINEWFDKAVYVAEQAELPIEDLDYLRSDLAKNVAIFQAKRQLFNAEIEAAYYNLSDIGPIKEAYPEAQDLFEKVDTLIKSRNEKIQAISLTLADGQEVTDQVLLQAKQEWKNRFVQNNE